MIVCGKGLLSCALNLGSTTVRGTETNLDSNESRCEYERAYGSIYREYSIDSSILVVIGAMMMRGAAEINWKDMEIALPAFITIVLMPFTYSIADGIAWGLISYVMIKLGVGKHEEVIENRILSIIALLMVMFYLGPGDQTTFEWILDNLN